MNLITIVRKCFRTELGMMVGDLERWDNGIGVRCFVCFRAWGMERKMVGLKHARAGP